MDLLVSLNGIIVADLTKDKNGGLHFSYKNDWVERQGARPISLSLPLSNEKYSGDRVYNFFDNLLPDNPGIRSRIQSRFKVNTAHAFDLLAAIGRDCVGAIQLSTQLPKNVKTIEYKKLTEQDIANILGGYKDSPLGMLASDDDFRISIAGAQEKTALLKIGNEWVKPMGATPTSHLLKLPIGVVPYTDIDLKDSCENEFICLALARAFGFDVANVEVLTFGEQKALSVERFDRQYSADKSWIMRLPQEDFCQAMGVSSAKKYQSDGGPDINACMNLLLSSSNRADRETFFKSQILFWLLAAIDGHAKNFSLFLNAGNRYQMTPLYDILSAYPMLADKGLQRQKIKMAMSLKGKNMHWNWDTIKARHFISTAEYIKYDPKIVKASIEFMFDNINIAINEVESLIPDNFPSEIAEAIFNGMRDKQKTNKLI